MRKIKLNPNEILATVCKNIIKIIASSQNIPIPAIEILGEFSENAVHGIQVCNVPDNIKKQINTLIENAWEAVFQDNSFVIPHECREPLKNTVLSLDTIQECCQSETPCTVLEKKIRDVCSQHESCDLETLPIQKVVEVLTMCVKAEVNDNHELIGLLTYEQTGQLNRMMSTLVKRDECLYKNVKCDNESYERAFYEPLFLEPDDPQKQVCLNAVYVQPKYSVKLTDNSIKRLCIYELLKEFLEEREFFGKNNNLEGLEITKNTFAVMILGKPGCGKSSFVSFLATKLSEHNFKNRPYYLICLRDMRISQINTQDPIQGLLEYMHSEEKCLENAILVLDGLDEVCAMYNGIDFHRYLNRLLQNLSTITGVQLIITSRTGYFKIDKQIKKYCLPIQMENWDNSDLEEWSNEYVKKHSDKKNLVVANMLHLQEEKYSDKKAIFAVPILFYMANAKGQSLENHKNICSVYDAVLKDVFEERKYDPAVNMPLNEVIPPVLARKICREIAFTMFRVGRISFQTDFDPYLSPDEVEKATEKAIILSAAEYHQLNEFDKKRIKDMYALTFYYNRKTQDKNAVEFAHKSIAEYFIAEKILENLLTITPDMCECEEVVCGILAECFGYSLITMEIGSFLCEKIHIKSEEQGILSIKNFLEKNLRRIAIDSKLFCRPKEYENDMHYLDRANVMMRSVLLLFEYLDGSDNIMKENPKTECERFDAILANIARMKALNSQYGLMIPLCLNGINLSNANFENCELSEAHLCEAVLEFSKFADANLSDAQLNGAILNFADFGGANLAGADLTEILCANGVDFSQASIQGADLSKSHFKETSFEEAEMQEAIMQDCVFDKGCSFYHTNLEGADLSGSDISKADIGEIILNEDTEDGVLEDDEFARMTWTNVTMTEQQYEYLQRFDCLQLLDCTII